MEVEENWGMLHNWKKISTPAAMMRTLSPSPHP